MCGISGILHFDKERPIDESLLARMTDIIHHRGPDGSGYFMDGNLGLGHRRLSIIDLNTGDQPMYSADGNIVLIFNGEIYNYLELCDELKGLGHSFRTTSDTEVIINAYKQWGFDCQKKFNGMWAFAIWDKLDRTLFISRDRLGEKPLNYAVHDNTFLFGSEIKSILAFGFPKTPHTELLELYLYLGYIPAPYTFYKGISKLKAGHYLIVKDGQITENKYWDLPDINEEDLVQDKKKVHSSFENLFRDSVRIRMRSDVPFGAFLSGGLDSASIVAVMSELSKFPVQSFTIGFEQKAFDERKLAQAVAAQYQTDHHEHLVEPASFDESLAKVLFHYDEPFADPAAIPTGYVSQYARKNVKMVLTGDGGDEVLSGYRAFRGEKFAHYYQKSPLFLRAILTKFLRATSSKFKGNVRYRLNKMDQILTFAQADFQERMLAKNILPEPFSPKSLISDSTITIEDFLDDVFRECRFSDPFYKLMYFQFKVSLPDQMLVKVDKIAMAHSLEARIPFLDPRLVEEMYLVDKSIKLPYYDTKSILRKTIGRKLPKAILNAPKRGFNVPLREWFKENSFQGKLQELTGDHIGLNNNLIKSIVEDNKSGKADNGKFIYRLMVFNDWMKSTKSTIA